MANQSTKGSFTVAFLRNGDQILMTCETLKNYEAGAAATKASGLLAQYVNPSTGAVTPDWRNDNNRTIIRIGAKSAAGYPVKLVGITFGYDGMNLEFGAINSGWTTDTSGCFALRLNDAVGDGRTYYELKPVANLASAGDLTNKSLTFQLTYISNGLTDTLSSGVDIEVLSAGENVRLMRIVTNRVVLDKYNDTALLRATVMEGSAFVENLDKKIRWLQGDNEHPVHTGEELTVTRDMVDGGEVFIAQYIDDSGNVLAQDIQRIEDEADQYRVTFSPIDGYASVTPTIPAKYKLHLMASYDDGTEEELTAGVSFTWKLYNADGDVRPDDDAIGVGDVVTITAEHAKLTRSLVAGDPDQYGPVDILATATFGS